MNKATNTRWLLCVAFSSAMLMGMTGIAHAARTVNGITIGAQTGTLTYGTAGSDTFQVTLTTSGGGTSTVNLTVTGLPAGATTSPASVTINTSPFIFTLTINTAVASPAGTTAFTLTTSRGGSGNGSLTIGQRTLNVSATGVNKGYDGTATATVTLSDNRVAGDTITDSYAGATFANKNVGAAKTVNVTGLSISGASAANYTLASTTAVTTANITARALTVSATGVNKGYDGTTAGTVTLSDNRIAGDVLTDAYTGAAFADKNVGAAKTVNVTGISISGTDAANYTANATAATTANITVRALTVSATGVNKGYDGTTATTVTLSDNRIAGDVLTDAYTSATFADKNAGTGKTVNVSGISISGTDAANYTANTTVSTTANITARALTVSATGVNKGYDGTTAGTVTLSDNRIAGDVLTDAYTGATFADKNVGAVKTVNVTGLSISGTDAANYTANATASTTANITARAITATADAKSKTYGDVDPALTYQLTSGSLAGADSFTGALSRTAGENTGTYAIQQGTLALSGNYILTYVGADLTINKANASVTVWPSASAITYGQTLADSTLSGGAATPAGAFAFTTPATAPNAGITSQSVTYTPTDTANYNTATGTTGVPVNKADQTITFNPIPPKNDTDAPFALDAIASSSLPVSYSISNPAMATINIYDVVTLTGVGGSTTITASQAGDNNRNAATSVPQVLTVTDTTPPVLKISTLPDGAVTNKVTLNITGIATDTNSIASIIVSGATVTHEGGAFNTALLLSEGTNTITVIATDRSNNQTVDTRTVTLDVDAPALTVTAPADNSTTVENVVDITGTIDAGSTVDAKLNGGSAQAALISGVTYTATVNLIPGMNTVEITAIDGAGRRNTSKRTIVSDAQGVTLQVTGPYEDNINIYNNIIIKGMVADYQSSATVTIDVDGQSYTPTVNNGVFGQLVTLPTETTYAAKVTAIDGSGHTSSVQRNLILISRATLTASVPSPQLAGTNIAFAAGVISGSGSYEYQFLLKIGNVISVVRDYSSSNIWTWDTNGLAAGMYTVLVYVRNVGSGSYVSFNEMVYGLVTSPAATGATLTANVASPQIAGSSITFTTNGSGGSGSYEYQYWLKTGSAAYAMVRAYSTTNTWTWDTSGLAAGSYYMMVYLRNVGSLVAYEATRTAIYIIVTSPPATGATLSASVSSPQMAGAGITFTAGGIGGSGSYEYRFYLKSGTTYTLVKDYSALNTWTWDTLGAVAGTYTVEVDVRNAGSPVTYETMKVVYYTIVTSPPATGATLTANVASPQIVGSSITFTTNGSGGSGPYEYQYWLKAGSAAYQMVRAYATTNTWSWNTSGAVAGTYIVMTYVRNVGSPAPYEVYKVMSYSITTQ